LVFLATLAMRKQRWRSGIIFSSFFRSLMAIYSDVIGEAGRPLLELRAGASLSSSDDDVVDPVNLKKDVCW
jgi:hypothetical protein